MQFVIENLNKGGKWMTNSGYQGVRTNHHMVPNIDFSNVVVECLQLLKSQIRHGMFYLPYQLFTPIILMMIKSSCICHCFSSFIAFDIKLL